MSSLSIMMLVGVVLCVVIYCAMSFVSSGASKDEGAGNPFECGFDPLGDVRVALSLRFFILIVLFLVFDVEIVLILPLVYYEGFSGWYYFSIVSIFVILVGGLVYEWEEGSLSWMG